MPIALISPPQCKRGGKRFGVAIRLSRRYRSRAMPFWSGETLNEWIPRFNIIDPFDAAQIDCAAYTLRMGKEAYITPDYQVSILSKHKIYRLAMNDHFIIPAGQFGFLLNE